MAVFNKANTFTPASALVPLDLFTRRQGLLSFGSHPKPIRRLNFSAVQGASLPAASAIDFHALSGVDRRRSRFTVSRPIELRSCMRSVPELIVTLRTRNGDPKSGSAAVLAFLRRADMTD